ncbi:hypothetical protein [uncultured Pseudacidovorax sp.]|uniref:hypothetical protein n=1 Tax=uncultured Pseudacidovorax sp. TaxID=679313 RepID=UPI0025F62F0A|nr:hypothetical protein [uncultured Pseudacidovorax sp.]
MITPQDDFFGHQTAAPLHEPAADDSGMTVFTERFWYTGQVVPGGRLAFNVGMGRYPGRGIVDGYAGVSMDGRQFDYQVSRHAGDRPLDPEAGALRIEVQAGFDRHRLVVAPNASGVAMDLLFHGRMVPNEEGRELIRKDGVLYSDVNRFVQLGRYEGWIEFDGRRHAVDADTCWGARDRSWGRRLELRTEAGDAAPSRFPPMFYAFACLQFEDEALHFFLKEKAPGQVRFLGGSRSGRRGQGGAPVPIVGVTHALDWDASAPSQVVTGGRLTLAFADGSTRALSLRALPGRYFLKGGLYGGLDGWNHGDDKGPLHEGARRWDFADPADRALLRSLADQVLEIRDGARIGYGALQCGLSPGYGRYDEVAHLPPM